MDPVGRLPEALAPVWQAVHARLSSGLPVTRVRVGPLDSEQQTAVADLLGLAQFPGQYPSLSLAHLDEALREVAGVGAREVVAQLVGPIGNRAEDRRTAAEARVSLWEWLDSHPVITAQPALRSWTAGVRRAGLIESSVERTRLELERALRVLSELPAAGVPLPVFADSVLDATHALDDGTRTANLVLKALAEIYDVPPPSDAPGRRALWERAGIADDELSSTVLAAGLQLPGDHVVGRILQACQDAGAAAVLTLQHLRASKLTAAPDKVWVFENPSVLALALARFGSSCPPLICTSGWPSSAGVALLKQLAQIGTTLCYHGDFDGDGLRIAANVVARTGAKPWRMTSADYLSAVADGPAAGRATPVPWDAELANHLTEQGKTVPEERVANGLLDEIIALP
ncbi:TIGR02679 family protein [Amycolatopsis sp. La24]|uniref:TIGR02679 family protein n=1 Tax=Amycolatopsis sp. La24 TaxID=3028304 RepID=UPI0023B0D178|nr:TIGR02679 family protein [Amycolatopsis sp. La24]